MKARGEILKQVQDDGVITVTRFITVPHKCSAGSPRKKHFPAKTPNKNLLLKVCRSRIRLKDIPKATELSEKFFLDTSKAMELSANIFLNIPKTVELSADRLDDITSMDDLSADWSDDTSMKAELSAKRLGDIRKRSEISAKDFADSPNRIFGGFGFG